MLMLIFGDSSYEVRILKQLKRLLMRQRCVVVRSAGQKKFFKEKYFLGAFSYGANVESDPYVKNYVDFCT